MNWKRARNDVLLSASVCNGHDDDDNEYYTHYVELWKQLGRTKKNHTLPKSGNKKQIGPTAKGTKAQKERVRGSSKKQNEFCN